MVTIVLVLIMSAYIYRREYISVKEIKNKLKKYEGDLD